MQWNATERTNYQISPPAAGEYTSSQVTGTRAAQIRAWLDLWMLRLLRALSRYETK